MINSKAHCARLVALLMGFAVYGCSGEVVTDYPEYGHVPAADLEDTDTGKADGQVFNPEYIIDDGMFVDAGFLTRLDLERFLEATPYGKRSFLADYSEDGVSFAEMVIDAGQRYRINPLVLVIKAQVESSLVFRDTVANQFTLDRAMGCGCPDDALCSETFLGLNAQISCAAATFRSYLDDIEEKGRTISGWGVGRLGFTSEDTEIIPRNEATAALYTYTPWVLRGTGGNWLFWNVYRKYSKALLKHRPNHRWIGGPCSEKDHCGPALDGCSNELISSGLAESFCTISCERVCPDAHVPYSSVTFCADMGDALDQSSEGWCVPRCDDGLYPSNGGCRAGFTCQTANRFGEDGVSASVCLPEFDSFASSGRWAHGADD